MSEIRFALISVLFLWGGNVCAQELDLFAEERAYKMGGAITGLYKVDPRNFKAPGYWEDMPRSNVPDTLSINLKKIEVSSFRYYVDENFFDTTFAYYNTSNFQQLFYKHPDSLETQHQNNLQDYSKLFRKVYGEIESYTPMKREILSFRDSVFKIAILTCRASFNGVAGQLKVALNATKKEKPVFAGMNFTPYDYSSVPFFSNISNLSIEYIQAKNVAALKKETSESFRNRIVNEKKLESSFATLNCDSIKQFTSSLEMAGNSILAHVIYDMPKEDKYLSLYYINEDKKFKLYDLGFIDKKRE